MQQQPEFSIGNQAKDVKESSDGGSHCSTSENVVLNNSNNDNKKIVKRRRRKRKERILTFDFIGKERMKVLQTTCDNSMFAVFKYQYRKPSSSFEGVFVLNDMSRATTGTTETTTTLPRRREEHIPSQHVVSVKTSQSPTTTSGSDSSLSSSSRTNETVCSIVQIEQTSNQPLLVADPTTRTRYIRTSISIKELLN